MILRLGSIDIEDVARLRLINDLFDIKCLATHVGFNKLYFLESSKDWVNDKIKLDDITCLLDRLEIDLNK